MDYLVNSKKAYSIKGGLKIEPCEILTNTGFNYLDIPPSVKARLRSDKDTSVAYMENLFGYTFTIADNEVVALPSDDENRKVGKYIIYKGKSVEAYEVAATDGNVFITACGLTNAKVEVLKVLYNCLSIPDITQSKLDTVITKIDTAWTELQALTVYTSSLTQGGTAGTTVSASGFIAPGSASFDYLPQLKIGTLKFKVLEVA